jgi:hypothetical protein
MPLTVIFPRAAREPAYKNWNGLSHKEVGDPSSKHVSHFQCLS